MNQNNKKILAEKLKNKLNSPEYIAMPDLINRSDWCPDLLDWFPGKENGWFSSYEDINPNGKKSPAIVHHNELEKDDWKEIAALIEKRNQERREVWEEKKKNITAKLNQQTNLYYHWGANVKHKGDIGSMPKKGMRSYLQLKGGKIDLFIAENHPVLDNFPFQVGFYVVDTDKQIEYSSQSARPNKFVEVGDQITITPVEVAVKPIEKPSQNEPKENNQVARGEDNTSQPVEKEIINWLTQYFQKNSVKEISLKDGELVITNNNNNNNNETKNQQQINNEPGLKNIQVWLEKKGKQSLSRQDLNIDTTTQNSPSQNGKNNYTPYLVGGVTVIGLVSIIAVSYYLGKKRGKKNIE